MPLPKLTSKILTHSCKLQRLQTGTFVSFQGIAGGTFLYITFFEVLPHELNAPHNRMQKLLFVLLGYICICCLLFITHWVFRRLTERPDANSFQSNGVSYDNQRRLATTLFRCDAVLGLTLSDSCPKNTRPSVFQHCSGPQETEVWRDFRNCSLNCDFCVSNRTQNNQWLSWDWTSDGFWNILPGVKNSAKWKKLIL